MMIGNESLQLALFVAEPIKILQLFEERLPLAGRGDNVPFGTMHYRCRGG